MALADTVYQKRRKLNFFFAITFYIVKKEVKYETLLHGNGSNMHKGTFLHKDTFARGVTFAQE